MLFKQEHKNSESYCQVASKTSFCLSTLLNSWSDHDKNQLHLTKLFFLAKILADAIHNANLIVL
jgi:hypothetical protein